MLSVVVKQISISVEWQTQIKDKELPACSTRYIPKACEKKYYDKIMERSHSDGGNVIYEAETEETGSMGTGGAVAGLACLVAAFLENSWLSLRQAQLLDPATSPAAAEPGGRDDGGGESGLGEQAGCVRRKEAEGPGTAAQR